MSNFDERLARGQKKHPVHTWWNKNGYKVMRILLWPVWLCIKINEKRYANMEKKAAFSKEQAKTILDRYLPSIFAKELQYLEDDEPRGVLLTTASDYGYHLRFYSDLRIPKRKKRDIAFRNKFFSQILDYLWTEYEIEGWTAVRLQNWQDWSRAEQKYGWTTCWDKDYAKGVYFVKED